MGEPQRHRREGSVPTPVDGLETGSGGSERPRGGWVGRWQLRPRASRARRRIELNLLDVDQLFNTMDPSPFHEKDLDHDAEEFILSWAEEFHLDDPLELVVHLTEYPPGKELQPVVERAVQHYFGYRARLNELEFRRLMQRGRTSLMVGLPFLALCTFAAEFLRLRGSLVFTSLLAEGLTIAGWVALWRPLEIYLYSWWPLRQRGKVFEKLSRMPVRVLRGS